MATWLPVTTAGQRFADTLRGSEKQRAAADMVEMIFGATEPSLHASSSVAQNPPNSTPATPLGPK
jgi:hypothetical protein